MRRLTVVQSDTTSQLAEQQTELLAQQAAAASQQEASLAEAREAHRVRQLEIERGIEHVTQQQQQQLAETEMLVEAQRNFLLESAPQQGSFGDGCGGPLLNMPLGGGCFSAKI